MTKAKTPSLEERILNLFYSEYECLTFDEIRRALDIPHTPKNLGRMRGAIRRLQSKKMIYSNPITYSKVVLQ